ncbi:MAG: helix-turn-helix domain-containing protein [Runella sp.]
MNISAIAQELGYKNQTVFARTFKKHFGKLPSQYMKEN